VDRLHRCYLKTQKEQGPETELDDAEKEKERKKGSYRPWESSREGGLQGMRESFFAWEKKRPSESLNP